MPEVDRPEPPYMQVVRHLREEITTGHLAGGDRIPSARKIAAEWNIAHATAAKVINTLKSEGLVETQVGVGTVVAARSQHRSAQDRLSTVHRTGMIYPPGHYAKIRSAELVTAPDHVVEALNLAPGSSAIRRQRTTYDADGIPQSTSVSWFDGALADSCPDLLVADRIRRGTVRYVAERTGRAVRTGRDGVCADAASPEVAAELEVPPGAPVLMSRNWWTDDTGWVAEFGESFSPPGRWIFYDYQIESSA